MFTNLVAWLKVAVPKVAGAALLAFLGTLIAGGTKLNLSLLHQALISGYVAGLALLDSLLANVVNPLSTSVYGAVRTRRQQAKAAKAGVSPGA